jgi:hypothetical protein
VRARHDPARERLAILLDEMEMPLARTAQLIQALEFVGYGLHSHGEDSADPILGLAVSLAENLDVVKTKWRRLLGAI